MVINAISNLFTLCRGGQCIYPCFQEFLTSTPNSILSKPLAAFQINIVETMDNDERGLHHGDTLRSFLTKHASFITNMGVENSRNKGQDDMINQNTAKKEPPL